MSESLITDREQSVSERDRGERRAVFECRVVDVAHSVFESDGCEGSAVGKSRTSDLRGVEREPFDRRSGKSSMSDVCNTVGNGDASETRSVKRITADGSDAFGNDKLGNDLIAHIQVGATQGQGIAVFHVEFDVAPCGKIADLNGFQVRAIVESPAINGFDF